LAIILIAIIVFCTLLILVSLVINRPGEKKKPVI